MSSIKTTQMDGDVSVGRNVAVGGDSLVQGDAHIKGTLRVDGWLDAQNVKVSNKGLFTTIEKLRAAYPNPQDGWWAIVGNSLPGPIYTVENGVWTATGETGGVGELDVHELAEAIDKSSQAIGEASKASRIGESNKTKIEELKEKQAQDLKAQNEKNTALEKGLQTNSSAIETERSEREKAVSELKKKLSYSEEILQKAKGVVKSISVTQGTNSFKLTPDDNGNIDLDIPNAVADDNVNPNSTNPVSSKAVASEFQKLSNKYGASLQLNEIGEGVNKQYSVSLLDERGEVIATTEPFSGGGGSGLPVTGNKIVLNRISSISQTIKKGQSLVLSYRYDHVRLEDGESTGIAGKAIVSISHGSNNKEIIQNLVAGDVTNIDVTPYINVGANVVKIKVEVDNGDNKQVQTISFNVNVVELILRSSFNISTVTRRGDRLTIPWSLVGGGQKTLHCYVDGVETETKTILSSQGNGSFGVDTSSLVHGEHNVQLVAEVQENGNTIKSNSIFFGIAIKEAKKNDVIFVSRFDFADGTIIAKGNNPYIECKQYDEYTLSYGVYNPQTNKSDVCIYENGVKVSEIETGFVRNDVSFRSMYSGHIACYIEVGVYRYHYSINSEASQSIVDAPSDGLVMKLTALGRSNSDKNKDTWNYRDITTTFNKVLFGSDGWNNGALRLKGGGSALINYAPFDLKNNTNDSVSVLMRFRASGATDDAGAIISCVDKDGTGFIITPQEARMCTKGKSVVSMKLANNETYSIAFVSYPKAYQQSSEEEKINDSMLFMYINGVLSGAVQRGFNDSVIQSSPIGITLKGEKCTLDVYSISVYSRFLSLNEVLALYLLDLNTTEELLLKSKRNDIIGVDGNINLDKLPSDLPYMIITGSADNGTSIALQAAINNNKKTKYDIDEILFVDKSNPSKNFHLKGGHIRLQGTSSLAYPIKNYRIYTKNSNKVKGELHVGCDEHGIGGEKIANGKYSFRDANGKQKASIPVDCWCLKADYAESSSSHNTGMARLVHDVLTSSNELTPVQRYASDGYNYDVRTTIDGFPILLFHRARVEDVPVFLGKFNFNNDKSTEEVFGFKGIQGYHTAEWVSDKFSGVNPTECWEFLNNDYPMGMFLDDDFDTKGEDGTPNWMKVFEARFPDDDAVNDKYKKGEKKPLLLERLVKWVKSTNGNVDKFKAELGDYFDINYLCDYYTFTDVFGCVDQRVKNMMMSFFYDPTKAKMLAYMIFYDNDTINGVRNDSRLKYSWDIDENTLDTDLSNDQKQVYAYAGHDSVLWKNLRLGFAKELEQAYIRLRSKMSNALIFKYFDKEQTEKFCERIYNLDALYKYVSPKTKGVSVNKGGATTILTYSYLESMQGDRTSHRHWWLNNRLALFDAKYKTGNYSLTDLTFKGNSAAGATIKAWSSRDFYFAFQREGEVLAHNKVGANTEWSYTYSQVANIGTIFHFYGGEFLKKLDLSSWGGFTDLNFPYLPKLETLILGKDGESYSLTELVVDDKMPMLRSLDMRNYTGLSSLDLSKCSNLEEVNALGCSSLTSLFLPIGAPINKLVLPNNYKSLTLRHLSELREDGLQISNKGNINSLYIENCRHLDAVRLLKEILSINGNKLQNVRLVGLELTGDGSDLKEWKLKHLGGLDASGNITENCKLVGSYQLTHFLENEDLELLRSYYDELEIKQPEYSVIDMDIDVADDANVTNEDNKTGYRYGKTYVPSGYIKEILSNRHRVLVKYKDGKAKVCLLDDKNSNYYSGMQSQSKLDGTEGEVMMYEPHYWYKGVNDYLNNRYYSCFYYGKNKPNSVDCKRITKDDLKKEYEFKIKTKFVTTTGNLKNGLQVSNNSDVAKIPVKGYKRVRFPSVKGVNGVGAAFIKNNDTIIKTISVNVLKNTFENGMYLIADIPSDAEFLLFTITREDIPFTDVILSNSERIEDMEPDWVEHNAVLVGVAPVASEQGKLMHIDNGGFGFINTSYEIVAQSAKERNLEFLSYSVYKDIVNLFVAKYGRRNVQRTTGKGALRYNQNSYTTSILGMQDTFVQSVNYELNYYLNSDGEVKDINSVNTLGYEDLYAKYQMFMSGIGVCDDRLQETNTFDLFFVTREDGTRENIIFKSVANQWIVNTQHGKYMDIINAGQAIGAETRYYGDYQATRSWTKDNICTYSGTSRNITAGLWWLYAQQSATQPLEAGCRLMFRGEIEFINDVEQYKQIQ